MAGPQPTSGTHTKKCPHCGYRNAPWSQFCGVCGTQLENRPAVPSTPQNPTQSPQPTSFTPSSVKPATRQDPEKTKNKDSGGCMIGWAGLTLIIIALLLAFFNWPLIISFFQSDLPRIATPIVFPDEARFALSEYLLNGYNKDDSPIVQLEGLAHNPDESFLWEHEIVETQLATRPQIAKDGWGYPFYRTIPDEQWCVIVRFTNNLSASSGPNVPYAEVMVNRVGKYWFGAWFSSIVDRTQFLEAGCDFHSRYAYIPVPTITSTVIPRDKIPPSKPEQVVAADALQKYANDKKLKYRFATYQTASMDSQYAQVIVVAEFWDDNNQIWAENSTKIQLRYLSNAWQADATNIKIERTANGQTALTQVAVATEQSITATADAIAIQYKNRLGGTLIYTDFYGGNAKNFIIYVRDSNGKLTALPRTGTYSGVYLAPDGSGFYLAVGDKIYFMSMDGSQKIEIPFDGWRLTISPDSQKMLASTEESLSFYNVTENQAYNSLEIETNKGILSQYYSHTWNSDSTTAYLTTRNPDGGLQLWKVSFSRIICDREDHKYCQISKDAAESIGTLSADLVSKSSFANQSALSPNGEDIAFCSDNGLYLYNLKTHITTQLVKDQVGHPIWSAKGDRIVYVTSEALQVYNLATGSTSVVLEQFRMINYPYRLFDWKP